MLLLPDGSRVMDSPQFPPEYMASAILNGEVKTVLVNEADDALFDAQGHSGISIEDYAIAMNDELEQPRHTRQRFTLGY